jgi:splicing factor 3A subunit 1
MSEHVRIELLDPRWKEKQRQMEANRSAGNLVPQGADVAASLRNLAKRRTDIFGSNATDEEKRAAAVEEARLTRERESRAWDGHIASSEAIVDKFATGANLDAQIEALHRATGLLNEGPGNIGPSIPGAAAPGMAPPAIDSAAFAGASISAAPNPSLQQPSAYGSTGFGSGYAGLPAPPPGTFPTSAAATGANAFAPNVPGIMRPADDAPEGEPAAKRRRLPEMPAGTFYPEKDWLEAHPVRSASVSPSRLVG